MELRCPIGWAMVDCTCTKPCDKAEPWPPERKLVLCDPPEKGWEYETDGSGGQRSP